MDSRAYHSYLLMGGLWPYRFSDCYAVLLSLPPMEDAGDVHVQPSPSGDRHIREASRSSKLEEGRIKKPKGETNMEKEIMKYNGDAVFVEEGVQSKIKGYIKLAIWILIMIIILRMSWDIIKMSWG